MGGNRKNNVKTGTVSTISLLSVKYSMTLVCVILLDSSSINTNNLKRKTNQTKGMPCKQRKSLIENVQLEF